MELGYSSMKPEQVKVAVALFEGRDVFAILPTGFGKSLCYASLPVAFDCQKKERGYSIVVVVSPLVAIMKDQVPTYSIKGLKTTYVSALIIRKRQRRRKRSIWVREWIRRRHKYGAYHHLMRELERVQAMDVSSYLNFVRMNASTFETLLTKVAPLIARKDTNMRDAIPPGECLAVTLRFLATGERYRSLSYLYHIPAQTIGQIVPDVCDAIVQVLQEFLKVNML
eukprot:Em0007g1283a